jgi:glycosyltransferase involved in cell wall biosynthesis
VPSGIPGVSVITPSRADGRGLTRALRSALDQGYNDIQLVVVTDGPGTDPGELATLTALRPPHRVLQLCPLTPPPVARPAVLRNIGLGVAEAPLVAFLDDDDWWKPGKLARQVEQLRDPGLVLVGSNATRMVQDEDRGPYHPHVPDRVALGNLINTNWLITSSVVCRTEVLRAVGGFPVGETLRQLDDYAAWLRVAAVGRVAISRDCLVHYTADRADSVSRALLSGVEMRSRALADFRSWLAHSGHRLGRGHARHLGSLLRAAEGRSA